jgi:hypothetical protein
VLLAQNELAPARDQLLSAVDFDAFLAKAQSDDVELGEALPLPDDPTEELGVVIGLIDYLARDEGRRWTWPSVTTASARSTSMPGAISSIK